MVKMQSLLGRSLLTLKDFTNNEITYLLDLSFKLKKQMKNKELIKPLNGYSMAMIFQKRSTRTRVSTETGISYLGGHALFLGSDDIQLGKNETLKDTSRVLSRFNDIILARVFGHDVVEELSSEGSVPVINALSDKYHPLQILADYMTIIEHLEKLEGQTIAWVGDGYNVLHSIMVSAAKMGIHLKIATPEEYRPDIDITSFAEKEAVTYGTNFLVTPDPLVAVKDANIIITDTWVSMGQDSEKEVRIKAFKGYQVTMDMLREAADNWKFMHCLPRKSNEVNDEVFYSDRSIIWDEAENRMYTVMAVTLALLGKSS